ncbi:uncharacterized protein SCHCODRAFT_01189514 [Schizophyllum commune H4-8]|nr:uncharacterized protein SCHCODRAFT_01189514 [Schizophyllum commune H4-8]KAI5892118.1 hypothetical protein SCHCODRAFT_01189514 [Schizophyllum commune H4-8]
MFAEKRLYHRPPALAVILTLEIDSASTESLDPEVPFRKSSRASRILNALVTLLFFSTSLGVITYVILLSLLLRIGVGAPPSRYLTLISKLDVAHAVTARLNYIISDAIVVWRAWILWPNDRVAQALLLLCMAYSAVAVIVNGALQANMSDSPVPHTIARSAMLVTNAVATALVGIKLCALPVGKECSLMDARRLYRRNVSASMSFMSGGGQVGGILVLLVESGVVYCIVWILEMSSINRSVEYLMNFGALTPVLAGIYPTFVVLVVTLQQHATAQAMIGTHTTGVPEPLRFANHRESLCFATNCGEALSEGDPSGSRGGIVQLGQREWTE